MRKSAAIAKLVAYLRKKGAKKILLFGSYSRGEQGKNSDIDLIVDFSKPKSLLEIISIENGLSAELGGKRIDLLSRESLSPYIASKVLASAKVLYS
jgi:predicted nucleotidyltransferase